MADASQAGSQEYVAFLLLQTVMGKEAGTKDRKSILDLYAECLEATKKQRSYNKLA